MNPQQKSYLKLLIIIVVIGIINALFNPYDGIQTVITWGAVISVPALLLLFFDARKQYDQDGNRIDRTMDKE